MLKTFDNINFSAECFKTVLSKGLGYGIVAGSLMGLFLKLFYNMYKLKNKINYYFNFSKAS